MKFKYIKESTKEDISEMEKILSQNLFNKYYFHLYAVDFLPDFAQKRNDGWASKWMTIQNKSNKRIGMIRISRADVRENTELAIFIYEKFSNKGFGTKAMKEVIKLCGEIGIKNIMLQTTSERLLKYYIKIGFKHTGKFESHSRLMDGKIYPQYSLQMLLK